MRSFNLQDRILGLVLAMGPLSQKSCLLLAHCEPEYAKLVASCLANRRGDLSAFDGINRKVDTTSTEELQRTDYRMLWEDVAANLGAFLPESARDFVSRGMNSAVQCKCIGRSLQRTRPPRPAKTIAKLKWAGLFAADLIICYLTASESTSLPATSRRGPKFPPVQHADAVALHHAYHGATRSFLLHGL
jgi:hypothetical protein